MTEDDPALRIYAAHAGALAARWQSAYSPAQVFAPVADLLPVRPQRIADIGAGPGREAVWLAGLGHDVTAVEPVQAFREFGGDDAGVTWLDDRLPDLALLRQQAPFDLLLLGGVWHHLAPPLRGRAMSALAAMLRPQGRVMISLRQGPDDPARGLYPAGLDEALDLAARQGLLPVAQRQAAAIQPQNRDAGISWIWLVLEGPV